MVKKRKLLNLIRKYIDGTASDKERAFVEKYYHSFDLKKAPSDSFSDREKLEMEENMLRNIHVGMDHASYDHIVPIYQNRYTRVAAVAVIAIIVAGAIFLRHSHRKGTTEIANEEGQIQDIAPGGNKAMLTLANGSTIALTHIQKGILTSQGNTRVIKLDSGQLVYMPGQTGKTDVTKRNDKVLYNTLSTPPGGNYRVVLPDGSKVWLNASSSLKFPTAFRGKERKVEVKGEAYFEVEKDDAHPFIVRIRTAKGEDMGTVKVLGTHFNIDAYMDNSTVKTTLVEGAIKVAVGSLQSAVLQPGEQATIKRKKDQIQVAEIDTKEAIAWKNGFFRFEENDIADIMHEIGRWYDVEVSYKNPYNPERRYSGVISRHTKLSQVLKILEAGGFHFKVTGRKIIVNP